MVSSKQRMQQEVFEVGVAVFPGLSGDGDRWDVRARVALPIPCWSERDPIPRPR